MFCYFARPSLSKGFGILKIRLNQVGSLDFGDMICWMSRAAEVSFVPTLSEVNKLIEQSLAAEKAREDTCPLRKLEDQSGVT